MFKSKTVFVVGAGASYELNLPIGTGLAIQIAEIVKTSGSAHEPFHDQAMSLAAQDYMRKNIEGTHDPFRSLHDAAHLIGANMPAAPSIDNFLHSHYKNKPLVALGKMAIARCIAIAERGSHVFEEKNGMLLLPLKSLPNGKQTPIMDSWYIPLWRTLAAGIDEDTVDKIFENVSFIVFNYDRCLEHFLYLQLIRYFGLPQARARSIMATLTIIHPYGQIGYLPWQSQDGFKSTFGTAEVTDFYEMSCELRTFTEAATDDVRTAMKQLIRNANNMIVLGFGYLEQNMTLLACQSSITRVMMTTLAMEEADTVMAKRMVGSMIGREPKKGYDEYLGSNGFEAHSVRSTCNQLWNAHRLRIQAEPIVT